MEKRIRALLICDIGFASPYWPIFCQHLAEEHNWDISVITPSMNRSQRNFFGLASPNERSYDIFETTDFKMEYRKHAGLPRIFRFFSSKFERIKLKVHNSKRSELEGEIDSHDLWLKPAFKLALEKNFEKSFDLVISTCLPFASHVIAHEIKAELGIPWLADYRDPYSYSHTSPVAPLSSQIEFEKNTLSNASICTTTSIGFGETIRKVYAGPISVIHNGFNSLEVPRPHKMSDQVIISYQGSIYDRYQRFDIVLEALDIYYRRDVVSTKPLKAIRLRFGGYSTHLIHNYFKSQSREIPEWIEIVGVKSAKETRKIQIESDFLLMLNWEDKSQSGVMQTKLYEYLSSGTNVIATGGFEDESYEILQKSGICLFFKDAQELAKFFLELNQPNQLGFNRNDLAIEEYSRSNQAKKIDEIAKAILKNDLDSLNMV